MSRTDREVRRCIYHVPYPLDPSTTFGGQKRAVAMLKALADWGEVWLVAGNAAQRRRQMKVVMDAVKAGTRFEFCYSESSTMPTALTEPHHLPTHPIEDFAFLARLRRHGIPVGLFYRDVYWKFPIYGEGVPKAKQMVAQAMYRYDLLAYRQCLDVLFLPSLRMGDWVDVGDRVLKVPLPPGHDIDETPAATPSSPLSLFYVGGLGSLYDLRAFCEAVSKVPDASLTICTRPKEWEQARKDYEPVMKGNIKVVHANGKKELEPYFAAANVAVLAMAPHEYRDFAAPLKLFEYIGNGKPIIATQNTFVGDVVSRDQIGWTVKASVDEFVTLLTDLVEHPDHVESARDNVMAARDQHTWPARVEQLADVLAAVDRR
ncbi:glycosyltransferase [Cutibacterium avidum]|uniref:glycosyltransferase n=1 Tax=Cutibacterium avidum TaxID=33010 RepID=UPI00192C5C81|nr:glycosyltransferase [Cutibacterium avidum]QQY15888.1 glycosyltransferase [Cutibacterium avidum]